MEEKKTPLLTEDRVTRVLESIALNNTVEKTVVPTKDGLAVLKNTEIIYLEADENYTTLHVVGGKKYVSSKGINAFEEKLDPQMFFRLHKSFIINIAHHLKEFMVVAPIDMHEASAGHSRSIIHHATIIEIEGERGSVKLPLFKLDELDNLIIELNKYTIQTIIEQGKRIGNLLTDRIVPAQDLLDKEDHILMADLGTCVSKSTSSNDMNYEPENSDDRVCSFEFGIPLIFT